MKWLLIFVLTLIVLAVAIQFLTRRSYTTFTEEEEARFPACSDAREYRGNTCGECQRTCKNRMPEPCGPVQCKVPACVCKPGYIRVYNSSSRCIAEWNCPWYWWPSIFDERRYDD